MTVPTRSRRPSQRTLPHVIAAFIAGVVLASALVPLLGADSQRDIATTGVPDFLLDDELAGGGGPDGPLGGVTTAGGQAGDGTGSGTTAGDAEGTQAATSGTASTGAPSPSAGGGATDVGVTADTIRVGVLSANCRACDSIGFLASKNVGRMAQVFADDINRRGGIHGRRLEVVVAEADPVADAVQRTNTDRQACLALTEGAQVFVAIVPYNNASTRTECYYDEHETPTLALGPNGQFRDPDTFNENQGRLFTVVPSGARVLATWARALIERGALDGHRFGVVVDDTTVDVTQEHFLAELERGGHEASHVSVMPVDAASFPSKAQTEQAAMRSKGIDTVFILINPVFMQIWLQQAEASGWQPQYHISDFPNFASEAFASEQPSSFHGAIALSYLPTADMGRSAADERCYRLWEEAIGGPTDPVDEQTYALHNVCNLFLMLERGATNAGPDLTETSLARGLAAIGEIPLAGVVGGSGTLGGEYGFGPVKFTAVDFVMWKRWEGDHYSRQSEPIRMPV